MHVNTHYVCVRPMRLRMRARVAQLHPPIYAAADAAHPRAAGWAGATGPVDPSWSRAEDAEPPPAPAWTRWSASWPLEALRSCHPPGVGGKHADDVDRPGRPRVDPVGAKAGHKHRPSLLQALLDRSLRLVRSTAWGGPSPINERQPQRHSLVVPVHRYTLPALLRTSKPSSSYSSKSSS